MTPTQTYRTIQVGRIVGQEFTGKTARRRALRVMAEMDGAGMLHEITETVEGPEIYTTLWKDGAIDVAATQEWQSI